MKATFAAALLTGALFAGSAVAAPADYKFDVVQQPTQSSDGGWIAVIKLVHAPSGRTVPDAEVYEIRAEPAPQKWSTPTIQKRTLLRPDGRGNYRLKETRVLKNEKTIKLSADIEGERSPVSGAINLHPSR